MTKAFGRRVLLSCFLCCQLSSTTVSAQAKQPPALSGGGLCTQWRQWQKDFVVRQKQKSCPQLLIEDVSPSQLPGIAARSKSHRIQINKLLNQADRASALKHELAHVFIHVHWGNANTNHPYFHEILALALSHDDQRILRDQTFDFPTAASAKIYLQEHFISRQASIHNIEAAISRLLIDASVRDQILQAIQVENPTTQLIFSTLIHHRSLSPRGPVAYLLKDSLTNEVLSAAGPVDRSLPVGSVLKPALLWSQPQLMSNVPSQDTGLWDCPIRSPREAGRLWDWRTALVKSCNGFFVDQKNKILNFSQLESALRSFVGNRFHQKLNIHSVVGLLPTLEMSVLEITNFYTWFVRNQSDFIDPLQDTARIGTLAGQEESAWFLNRKIALKSGTVRSVASDPVAGWIVAWIPDSHGEYRYVASIQSPGYSGFQLLRELKKRLEKESALKAFEKTQVQILGLLPKDLIQFGCEKNDISVINGELYDSPTQSQIRSGQVFRCMKGPVMAQFPRNNGKSITRAYWGEIRFTGRTETSMRSQTMGTPMVRTKRSGVVTEKQLRARSGSAFLFTTSERSYVARTLHAEHAAGRKEVLKSLAFVLRNNSRLRRHGNEANCDTTHCQVFLSAEDQSEKNLLVRKRLQPYFAAFDAITEDPIQGDAFLEFSLGGKNPWTRKSPLEKLNEFAQAPIPAAHLQQGGWFRRLGDEIWISSRKFSCETFRSAFRLLSCPERAILRDEKITFFGRGEGHGRGLDIVEAEAMAAQGRTYREILAHFY